MVSYLASLRWLSASLAYSIIATDSFSLVAQTHQSKASIISVVQDFHTSPSTSCLLLSRDWIDEVDDLDKDECDGPPIPPDMKYIPRNVMRQNKNFVAIREAGGKELTNDLYVREPSSQVFWFVGKIARISDVTTEQAIDRQWPMIENHAANLRPLELYPARGSLEIWVAPGDSEMDVAYNRPHLVFQKMERNSGVGAGLKSTLMGFQGEMYDAGEEGFRAWRLEDGRPAKPEIQSPNQEDLRPPTEEEMAGIQSKLEGQDISSLYEEQQRRAGKSVDN